MREKKLLLYKATATSSASSSIKWGINLPSPEQLYSNIGEYKEYKWANKIDTTYNGSGAISNPYWPTSAPTGCTIYLLIWKEPAPTPTPTLKPTATPTPSADPTPTPSADPTPTPSADPTPTPSADPTPTPSADPTPTPSADPTPTPNADPTPTPNIPWVPGHGHNHNNNGVPPIVYMPPKTGDMPFWYSIAQFLGLVK